MALNDRVYIELVKKTSCFKSLCAKSTRFGRSNCALVDCMKLTVTVLSDRSNGSNFKSWYIWSTLSDQLNLGEPNS